MQRGPIVCLQLVIEELRTLIIFMQLQWSNYIKAHTPHTNINAIYSVANIYYSITIERFNMQISQSFYILSNLCACTHKYWQKKTNIWKYLKKYSKQQLYVIYAEFIALLHVSKYHIFFFSHSVTFLHWNKLIPCFYGPSAAYIYISYS